MQRPQTHVTLHTLALWSHLRGRSSRLMLWVLHEEHGGACTVGASMVTEERRRSRVARLKSRVDMSMAMHMHMQTHAHATWMDMVTQHGVVEYWPSVCMYTCVCVLI